MKPSAKLIFAASLAAFPACKHSDAGSGLKDTTEAPADTPPCKVLVAMSDASTLVAVPTTPLSHATKNFEFGFLLDEMAIPVQALLDAGCQVVFANPTGVEPPRDKSGDSALFFTDGLAEAPEGASLLTAAKAKLRLDALVPGAKEKAELASALRLVMDPASPIRGKGPGSFDTPRRFAEFLGESSEGSNDALSSFQAIFVPGGYAPMLNLWNDAELGAVLRWFHANGKVTFTLCRGGVSLRSAATEGGWIYSGYRMTTYSSVEDDVASLIGGVLPFYQLPFHPNHKLRDVGAALVFQPFHSNVVDDRDLMTGENQWSAHELGAKMAQKITGN